MSYVGLWKFGSVSALDENDQWVSLDAEQYMARPINSTDEDMIDHEKQTRQNVINTMMDVCEDGKIYVLLPIPEHVTKEMIDEAVSSGKVTIRGDLMVMGSYDWEDRDGVLYFDTGIEGEVVGEKVSSWAKGSDDDGNLKLLFTKYVRA